MYNSEKIKIYKPFGKKTDFLSYADTKHKILGLINKKLNYKLIIRPGGYLPKTGILLCDYLNRVPLRNLKVLDCGTGETALLAVHSAALGAKRVTAINIDDKTAKLAKRNVKINNLLNKIEVKRAAISKLKTNRKFDLILSNPPQMPVKKQQSLHDDGGKDGKYFIKRLIKLASQNLKKNGRLIFTAFDFLGINKSFNKEFSLFEFLKQNNFSPKIVARFNKKISQPSYTFKNLKHIKKIYPDYIFRRDKNGVYTCKIYIVFAIKI